MAGNWSKRPRPQEHVRQELGIKPDPVPREIGREPRRPEPEPVDELDEARRELADLTEWWKTEPPREVRDVQRIIDVAREASERPSTRTRSRADGSDTRPRGPPPSNPSF